MNLDQEIRAECLDKAIRNAGPDRASDKIIETAKKFETYIKGESNG